MNFNYNQNSAHKCTVDILFTLHSYLNLDIVFFCKVLLLCGISHTNFLPHPHSAPPLSSCHPASRQISPPFRRRSWSSGLLQLSYMHSRPSACVQLNVSSTHHSSERAGSIKQRTDSPMACCGSNCGFITDGANQYGTLNSSLRRVIWSLSYWNFLYRWREGGGGIRHFHLCMRMVRPCS